VNSIQDILWDIFRYKYLERNTKVKANHICHLEGKTSMYSSNKGSGNMTIEIYKVSATRAGGVKVLFLRG